MTWLRIMLVSFLFGLLFLPFLINFLKKSGIVVFVREVVTEHIHKTGTPKAGGILFLIIPFIASVFFNPPLEVWALLILFLGSGILGMADDLLSSIRKTSLGLRGRYKLIFQIILGLIFGFLTMKYSVIWIPYIPPLNIGWWYIPLAVLVVVSSENAVNLTDGADGLATTVFLTVMAALLVVGYLQGQVNLFPFMYSLMGVLAAFLWFNTHPARIIMGDTGSLALGGAMAGLSLILHIPLFLPFIAMVFVLETMSVIVQIGYFRRTGGKRFFKRAPLHHHFQLSGWSETQIVVRFALLNLLFIGLAFLFIWV
ncbi:MAG: phospho-N-acetylmuramoyl-pentapeptide-transferase [Caldiserica bacterium]|jgi:phospho-N-acetylmuramoyl-pentapeptide-transferase|nr:phospho-N-acetylmuramoyl-pentapeptide-transferase [Caldisericota bacterium]MDH7562993.1 phospho-N-acetylmuramoyl-pentapeptide-transferase [Caldisericota bacterium]